MENGAQTIATFNGVLLRREQSAGRGFVQLVFREADKDWLCLSSDLANTKLQIGKKYRIEGIFKRLGERAYIHEPRIQLLTRQIVKRRVVISLAVALAILLTAGGIVLAASHKSVDKPSNAPTTPQTPVVTVTQTPQTTNAQATSQTSTDTTPTTTASTSAPKTTKPTATTNPVVVPPVTPPATTPVVTPSTPDCDAIVVTPFESTTTSNESEVHDGVDGQTQTCYPDGRSASGVTIVLVVGQPQVTLAS